MKKILLAAAFVAVFSGTILAADCNPPLLCDSDTLKAPTQTGTGVCPPPAPVCEPAPEVCAPPPPVCPPVDTCSAPAKPKRKKVWVEECYTENEVRTQIMDEVKTRTATRKVAVESTKEVGTVKLVKIQPPSGRAPRLVRKLEKKTVPTTIYVKEQYEETYTVPVKTTYTMPVTKTRKVAQYVEE